MSGASIKLTFFRQFNNDRDFWFPPAETGNWGADNRIGRSCAEEMLEHCCAEVMPMMLAHITAEMVRKGRFEGIETGFFARLGEIAGGAKAAIGRSPTLVPAR